MIPYPPVPTFHRISATEYIFTHYLNAWSYTQNQHIEHYSIEKINEHEWKLTILST
jgi:hypothetical protein